MHVAPKISIDINADDDGDLDLTEVEPKTHDGGVTRDAGEVDPTQPLFHAASPAQ